MTQKSVSRKQRYNTLDFAEQNRVPTGMIPLQSLISLAGAYTNCKRQLALPALKIQKKAVLSHDTRVICTPNTGHPVLGVFLCDTVMSTRSYVLKCTDKENGQKRQ